MRLRLNASSLATSRLSFFTVLMSAVFSPWSLSRSSIARTALSAASASSASSAFTRRSSCLTRIFSFAACSRRSALSRSSDCTFETYARFAILCASSSWSAGSSGSACARERRAGEARGRRRGGGERARGGG